MNNDRQELHLNQDNADKLKRQMELDNPKMPFWCYKNEKDEIKVNFKALGELIQKEHNYLFITNKNKETLYEYNYRLGYWLPISKGSILKAIHDKLVGANQWQSSIQNTAYNFIYSGIPRKQFQDTIGRPPEMAFNFLNGVYNWNTGQLEPHNKKYYFEGCTNYLLDMTNVETPETDKYFNLLFGENAKTIMEFIGYMFYPSYEPIQCFVILKNDGGDGKSWFVNHIIKPMFGKDNISNISLTQLANEKDNKFKLKELFHKSVNVSSELSEDENHILPTGTLKKLTGNDGITADVKGKDDIDFTNYAKLLILTNPLIAFRDDSKGFRRRVYIILAHKILNFESIIDINKIDTERGAFAYKCIKLAKKAMKRKELTKTNSINQLVNEWMLDNDPVQQFINEMIIIKSDETEPQEDVKNAYDNWSHDNGYKPYGKIKFREKMAKKGFIVHDERPLNKTTGKRYYIHQYTGIMLNDKANRKAHGDYVVKRWSMKGKP